MKKYIFIAFIICTAFLLSCSKDSSGDLQGPSGGEGAGKGGSMAKFTIANDHLFLINEKELLIYNIDDEANPVEVGKLEVDFGIVSDSSMWLIYNCNNSKIAF